jgi:hypothetical protein
VSKSALRLNRRRARIWHRTAKITAELIVQVFASTIALASANRSGAGDDGPTIIAPIDRTG